MKIRKLGPVANGEIDLGDVTLFLGPPNTGKGYALRAIYTKLFPLDDYALGLMEEKLSERLTVYLERKFPKQETPRDVVEELLERSIATHEGGY